MFFREKCDLDCAIRGGQNGEGSGQFYVHSRLGKAVFWFANESPGLVFDSEVWERLVVVRAYNASDSCKRFVVGIGVT